jgi:hypothetical protein
MQGERFQTRSLGLYLGAHGDVDGQVASDVRLRGKTRTLVEQ